jgi:AcrR family transcriptional regulator
MPAALNVNYHHGNLRHVLLDVALSILAREGEDGVGLRDLARIVGVSPAAPYRHFDSRAALLEALAVTGFARLSAALKEGTERADENRTEAMGKAYVNFALDNANLFRLMFSPQLKKDGRPGLKIAADLAFDAVRSALGAANSDIKIIATWAKVHGLAVLLLDGQITRRGADDAELLLNEVLTGL